MKKKDETRYFVTSVASVPVYKVASKTEMYRMATKPGWGAVEWYSAADGYKNPVTRDRKDKTQQLCCDEDTSASLYLKNGGYFGIFPYEEINVKEMPKQAEVAAIIYSDSCGFTVWAEDFNQIHFFVTYDANGLIDSYRIEYGDGPIYDGEVEISFEDLYERAEEDWRETYRAELAGTVEYKHKQEAAATAAEAGATWMDEAQQEDFRQICNMIDTIKSGRDFYRVMSRINNGGYSVDVINAAREFKQCFNSAQYEPQQAAPEAASKGQKTALGTPEDMAGTDTTEAAGGQQAAPQAGEINLGKLEAGTRPGTGEREPGKQPGGP